MHCVFKTQLNNEHTHNHKQHTITNTHLCLLKSVCICNKHAFSTLGYDIFEDSAYATVCLIN